MTAETDPPVPTGTGKRWWSKLSKEERELHTDWRFKAGHRNKDIMEVLKLSVGTVAGMKHRWELRMKGAAKDVTPENTPAMPQLEPSHEHMMESETEIPPETVAAEPAEMVSIQTVTTEPVVEEPQEEIPSPTREPLCEWPLPTSKSLKPGECGKPVVPGLRCCAEHAHLVYGKRFKAD